jgi:hypothetical protein
VNHLQVSYLASIGDAVLVVEKNGLRQVRHKTFVDHFHIVGLVNIGTDQLEDLLLDGSKTVDHLQVICLASIGDAVLVEEWLAASQTQDVREPSPCPLLYDSKLLDDGGHDVQNIGLTSIGDVVLVEEWLATNQAQDFRTISMSSALSA